MSRIPARYIGYKLKQKLTGDASVTIEIFGDYLCPFSGKAFSNLKSVVDHYQGKVEVKFINMIQPWHPQSYYLSKLAAIAYKVGGDEKWQDVAQVLFENNEKFVDEAVYEKSAKQIWSDLMTLMKQSDSIDNSIIDQFSKYENDDSIVVQLKCHQKYARQNSIHVTPSFAVNGILEGSASSSWSLDQWKQFLSPIMQ